MQKRFVAFLIAVLVAAGAGLATAQERFGGLTGIVTDASGAVLPGATVTITSKTTGAARTIVTSGDGLYNRAATRWWSSSMASPRCRWTTSW
jgi:hypothetical protein